MTISRVEKAMAYMDKHKAKKYIIMSREVILKDLESDSTRIHGATASFMTAICNRFKVGFFLQEYMDILTSLTGNYTEKQIKYYNWV